ncbi:hypothetical protein O6H91_19G019900 [Diphasiastrum complanatum]|uniref:Uncharacterized protein n=2 Tax=Diphasiastrum complanatum TaxID=34168 RepID=A0ACC2AT72_DIPCM|nr:hypothetical protein O6H91_19G019900 [Diphasiastrum complanatum]KAJ7520732.1 hypothetical protein O6H91_19G019900 [Diphasiastrum complanatum]
MATSTASTSSQQLEGTTEQKERKLPRGFAVLEYIGFKLDFATAGGVQGRFTVSDRSCQPFGVLHGGISAFIAESLASIGAEIASNWKRIAGIELSMNHLHAIRIGEEVVANATPLMVGNRLQVWDVKLSTSKPQDSNTDTNSMELSAVARVTLIVGLPSEGSPAKELLQQYSKL